MILRLKIYFFQNYKIKTDLSIHFRLNIGIWVFITPKIVKKMYRLFKLGKKNTSIKNFNAY